MLSLLGSDRLLETTVLPASPYTVERLKPLQAQEYSEAYLRFLNVQLRTQGIVYPANLDFFASGRKLNRKLAMEFSRGGIELDDLNQGDWVSPESVFTPEEESEFELKFQAALEHLYAAIPESKSIFPRIVRAVFFRPCRLKAPLGAKEEVGRAVGDSSSGPLGAIWINGEAFQSRAQFDCVEFLCHELTHQCLFIEELREPFFDYTQLKNPDTYAFSAILKRPRPIDKVFHSIFVGTELLLLRRKASREPELGGLHPESEDLAQSLKHSLFQLLEQSERFPNLLSPRALELLSACKAVLNSKTATGDTQENGFHALA